MERWQGQTALPFWHAIFLSSFWPAKKKFSILLIDSWLTRIARLSVGADPWLIISVLDDAMIHLVKKETKRRKRDDGLLERAAPNRVEAKEI